MTTKTKNANIAQGANVSKKELNFAVELDNKLAEKILKKAETKKRKSGIYKENLRNPQIRKKIRAQICTEVATIDNNFNATFSTKGLIDDFLRAYAKQDIAKAKNLFSEITDKCKTLYVAEDNFQNISDYTQSTKDSVLETWTMFLDIVKKIRG